MNKSLSLLLMALGIASASAQATAIDASALILGTQDSTETAAPDTATDSDFKKWYVQIGGSYTFYSYDVTELIFFYPDSGSGWSASVKAGYRFTDWIALEGGISYDQLSYDNGTTGGFFRSYSMTNKIKAVNFMIGPAFEFTIAKPVAFYVSPQIGISIAQGSTTSSWWNSGSSTGDWKGLFAYELRAGFLFKVSELINIYVGYRLSGIAGGVNMNSTSSTGDPIVEQMNPLNNGIEAGLRFNF